MKPILAGCLRGQRPTRSGVTRASFRSSHEQWPAMACCSEALQHSLNKKSDDSEMHYCLIVKVTEPRPTVCHKNMMARGCTTKRAAVRNESSTAERQLSEPQVKTQFSGDLLSAAATFDYDEMLAQMSVGFTSLPGRNHKASHLTAQCAEHSGGSPSIQSHPVSSLPWAGGVHAKQARAPQALTILRFERAHAVSRLTPCPKAWHASTRDE